MAKPKLRTPLARKVIDSVREYLADRDEWRGPRTRDGGHTAMLPYYPLTRGTTYHTAGLWPFPNGSTTPTEGAPLGVNITTGDLACFDPLGWFDAGYLFQPSAFVLGSPGIGKSSFNRKMIAGVIGRGDLAMILGDHKNEYSKLVAALGDQGQVIPVGPGKGYLNVLDPGGVAEAVARIDAELTDRALAEELIGDLTGELNHRRKELVVSLLEIVRGARVPGHEAAMIDAGLRHLSAHHEGVPILSDLLAVFAAPPDTLAAVTTEPANPEVVRSETREVRRDLAALCSGVGLGEIFNGHNTHRVRPDTSVCFDVSSIPETDHDLLGATYLAAWGAGFGALHVMRALSRAGLTRRRRYLVVLDEFWLPMSSGPGMVDRAQGLTRLNRLKGVGVVYCTHTLSDLKAIRNPEDIAKAQGIASRCGVVVLGGLRDDEIRLVNDVVTVTTREWELLKSWGIRPDWTSGQKPPGMGKFIIKTAGNPGLPIVTRFSAAERSLSLHDTNQFIRREEVTA